MSINDITADIDLLAPPVARRLGLDDMGRARIANSVLIRVSSKRLRDTSFANWLNDPNRRRAYLRRALKNAGIDLVRKMKRQRTLALAPDELLRASRAPTFDPLALEDAERIFWRVWQEVGCDGHLVLELVRRNATPEQIAAERGLSRKQITRRVAKGVEYVRHAIARVVGEELGREAVDLFINSIALLDRMWPWFPVGARAGSRSARDRAVRDGTLAKLRLYRSQVGETAYRLLLRRLSADAVRVIELFRGGASCDDVVEDLSWKYHQGTGRRLVPDEIRAGEIEFVNLISQIRAAIEQTSQGDR